MRLMLGLWLVQGITAGVTLGLPAANAGQAAILVVVLLGLGALAALWIGSALRDQRRLGEARLSERMSAKTADLQAELARARAEEATRLRDLTEKLGKPRRGFLKAGLVSGGALGVAAALVVTQVLTLGLVAMAFVGGGAAGYAVRGRFARLRPVDNEREATGKITEAKTIARPRLAFGGAA